jgi:hypothetical protein
MIEFLKAHPAALVALGGSLASIGAMGANLSDWDTAMRPGFVFPALGLIGSNLVGIFGKAPTSGS